MDVRDSANQQISNGPQIKLKNVSAIKMQKNNQIKISRLKFYYVEKNEKKSEKINSE